MKSSPATRPCRSPDRALSLILERRGRRHGAQTDLDEAGIAKNAREEKLAARRRKRSEAHAEMAALRAARAQGAADDSDSGSRR